MEIDFLKELKVGKIFDFEINDPIILNLNRKNKDACSVVNDVTKFSKYVDEKANGKVAIGQYKENRTIYDRHELFSKEQRTIHLGIDLFYKEGTNINCIYDGKVHSFNDNFNPGDYGPTIILEHEYKGKKFYTLYGHLSRDSLVGLKKGKIIEKGEMFAKIGNIIENCSWPPHLHFEIIMDMMDKEGDFPGVTNKEKSELYFNNCPNPNILLRIKKLS